MRLVVVLFSSALAAAIACNGSPTSPSTPLFLVGPTGNFGTIGAALAVALPGDEIRVQPGSYAERVVIDKTGIKLRGERSVLDGSAAGLDGTGIGVRVANVADVEVSGLVIQNFERGLVLENVSGALIQNNEVLNSNAKTPPFVIGTTPFEGIVLIASRDNDIRDNFAHDNGHDGLMLTGGSSGNRISNNRFVANGAQTATRVG